MTLNLLPRTCCRGEAIAIVVKFANFLVTPIPRPYTLQPNQRSQEDATTFFN